MLGVEMRSELSKIGGNRHAVRSFRAFAETRHSLNREARHDHDREHEEDDGDRILEEDRVLAAGQRERAPVIGFDQVAEHDAEHGRQERESEIAHEIAEQPRRHDDAEIEQRLCGPCTRPT